MLVPRSKARLDCTPTIPASRKIESKAAFPQSIPFLTLNCGTSSRRILINHCFFFRPPKEILERAFCCFRSLEFEKLKRCTHKSADTHLMICVFLSAFVITQSLHRHGSQPRFCSRLSWRPRPMNILRNSPVSCVCIVYVVK